MVQFAPSWGQAGRHSYLNKDPQWPRDYVGRVAAAVGGRRWGGGAQLWLEETADLAGTN